MTEPTDAELDMLIDDVVGLDSSNEAFRKFARAVLAKWGASPVVAGEPVWWMWQHDETGRTGFVDCWQVENGWQENNPRLRLVSRLYRTQQPTRAQAGAVPLTAAQKQQIHNETGAGHALICLVESYLLEAHNIKGGQHGAE